MRPEEYDQIVKLARDGGFNAWGRDAEPGSPDAVVMEPRREGIHIQGLIQGLGSARAIVEEADGMFGYHVRTEVSSQSSFRVFNATTDVGFFSTIPEAVAAAMQACVAADAARRLAGWR